MHLDESRTRSGAFKMERNCLDYIRAEFIPTFSLSENAVSQCASAKATFLRIANLEDELHDNRIPDRGHCLIRTGERIVVSCRRSDSVTDQFAIDTEGRCFRAVSGL